MSDLPAEPFCPQCGLSAANLRALGLLGCAGCYRVFDAIIAGAVAEIHGTPVATADAPAPTPLRAPFPWPTRRAEITPPPPAPTPPPPDALFPPADPPARRRPDSGRKKR